MAKNDCISSVGLYMVGHFIQVDSRDWISRETGERTTRYYVTVAAGKSVKGGAVNVGISEAEYNALQEQFVSGALSVGACVLCPVESFGYKDNAYFRAVGPVSMLADSPIVVGVSV